MGSMQLLKFRFQQASQKIKFWTKLLVISLILLCCFCDRAMACPNIDGLVDLNCDGVIKILAFGDSITSGVGDSTRLGYPGHLLSHFPKATIYNLGRKGESSFDGRSRVAASLRSRKGIDYSIVMEGANDFWRTIHSPSMTRSNLLYIRSRIKSVSALSMLGNLTAVKRAYQRNWILSVNSAIRRETAMDFYKLGTKIIGWDGLHPSSTGYKQMALAVAKYLRSVGAANRPKDIDKDGIYDFAEKRFGCDPKKADTDGDGLKDGDEVFRYKSNPNKIDSDNDGLSDYEEIRILHSDPNDAKPSPPNINNANVLLGQ